MTGTNDLPDWLAASTETHDRLSAFLALVAKWNGTINLVSASSLTDGWQRHVLDSAQLFPLGGTIQGRWLDIGSGAGFPGIVVAILAKEHNPMVRVALVESDRRKATFLSEAARQLGLQVDVICDRIEQVPPMGAKVISARAFAPLGKLLSDAERHWAPEGIGLFLKGKSYLAEVLEAKRHCTFDSEIIPSKTDEDAVVLMVSKVKHVGS